MRYLLPALFCLGLLAGCVADGTEGRHELLLSDSIYNELQDRRQLRRDTFYGAEARFRRDSIQRVTSARQWRTNEFIYPTTGPDTLIVATIDSVPGQDNIIRLTNGRRVRVEIPATDVVLNGDSVRLGVIHILGPAFGWFGDGDHVTEADHLILTGWGRDHVPFAMDQDNIGPISRQTSFRVGRHHYFLESVDSTRRRLVVRELEGSAGVKTTAELDLVFKRVAVKDLEGNPTTIAARPGRRLALYFWGLGARRPAGSDVVALDSLYHGLPVEQRDLIDIVLVNRTDDAARVQAFIRDRGLRLPVYLAAPNTCRNLNCRPNIPYWVGVNERGRIVSFYNRSDALITALEEMGPEEAVVK